MYRRRSFRWKKIRRAGKKVLRFIYPLDCLVCGERIGSEENALCPDCLSKFEEECADACPYCGKRHDQCICTLNGMRQIHLAPYHSTVARKLILTAKDHAYTDLLEFTAVRLTKRIREEGVTFGETVICYVPRAPETVREKGCDQSKLLAEEVAGRLHVSLVCALRHGKAEGSFFSRRAKEQKTLTPAERRKAASRGYALIKSAAHAVKGKQVYLIDDVITTGATMCACAELLKKAGAAFVTAVSVAKS